MNLTCKSLLVVCAFGLGVQCSGQDQNTAPLNFKGSIAATGDTAEIAGKMNRAWKYSFGQEPAAKLLNRSNNEMTAKAHFYFKSELITNRQDTRGVISYEVNLKAVNGKCIYDIRQFIHRGNTSTRGGGIHFGRLMKGADPGGNIRGIGRRNIHSIHQDMKNQVEARITLLLGLFNQHFSLSE